MTLNEWKDIFGDNLETLLEENNMSQTQLARESGVSPAMISEYINKRSVPGLVAAINIAYVFGISVSDLVDFEEPID